MFAADRLSMKEYDKGKLLTTLDIVRGGKINNGGYALFGKNAKIGLKLASYATDNKVTFTDLKLLEGNIYNLVNAALDYILNRINWRSEIGARKRKEIPEIPEEAIREIIVNVMKLFRRLKSVFIRAKLRYITPDLFRTI